MTSSQNSPDNLFLRGHALLRNKRLSLPVTLTLLTLLPLLILFVLMLWFGQVQLQRDIAGQADQAGNELARQVASLVADPLAANDNLSLNIILAQWVQNPVIAHASLVSSNNRVVAEAGRRPAADSLAPGQGRFIAAVHFRDELIGQLHLSLAREPFTAPAARLLQRLLWSTLLLALVFGLIAWRHAVNLRRTQAEAGNGHADSKQSAPGLERLEEPDDLTPSPSEPRSTDLPPADEPEPEPVLALEPETADTRAAGPDNDTAAPVSADAEAAEQDAGTDPAEPPVLPLPASTVLAIRLANMHSLHQLPRPRLLALLESYREHLEQVSRVSEGILHTLEDGTSLILFHPEHPDQLGAALYCGELLRVLGHDLQVQIADTGIALHTQLALCHTPCQNLEPDQLPAQSDDCAQMLQRLQHSRNLLLLDSELAGSGLLQDKAILRRLASQPGTHCVERLLEPYQSQLKQQLANNRP